MKIRINANKYGSLFATTENGIELFQFEHRKTEAMGGPAWYFWIRGTYDPDIFRVKRSQFPMEYFLSAVRAKSFILYGTPLDESVEIIGWMEHIGKK